MKNGIILMRVLFLGTLIAYCSLTVRGQESIVEHEGNNYIIHVEQLNPDKEMTLLDVLHICPELMSNDGKKLTADYLISVDNIILNVDYEPLLEGIKACELSEVTVCTYGAVNNNTDGVTGTIDLHFREEEGLTGKLGLNGSTYGNGRFFGNIASSGNNVTVRAFAQTNLQYGKANSSEGNRVTSRNGVENAMLFVDWQATENDLLKLKLSQGYTDQKNRLYKPFTDDVESDIERDRWGELVATYERTLNEQEAGLYLETGMDYASSNMLQTEMRSAAPWWITEFSVPLFKHAVQLTAGYEGGYTNLWYKGLRREQNLYNDIYLMLDYKKGPWVISLGDRFRHNTFWDKHDNEGEKKLWVYNRNDHALHASVGYCTGHHFVQGTFSRTFFNPLVSDFHEYLDDGPVLHSTDYDTNLAWRSEVRYTYQNQRLVATASVTNTLLTDMLTPNESLTGMATALTWHRDALRLTAGVNLYYQHVSSKDVKDNTFCILKFAPTLLLGKGFRLSSVLLYNTKDAFQTGRLAHLYASVKLNKDLGKRCNVYADFHNLTGQPKEIAYFLRQSYKNRTLTLGLTYYPWRR